MFRNNAARRILVTGANRGIGLALTRFALDRGDTVFATCRRSAEAGALQSIAGDHTGNLHVLELELLEPRTHQAARLEVESRTDALDILINNAGINYRHPSVAPEADHRTVERLDARSMVQMLRVNTVAPLLVTREFLPLLKEGSDPCVAFLSSGMGSIGRKDGREIEYSYSASKAALNMLARVLAHEVGSDGISVVCLNPGWVATDMGTARAPLQPDDVAPGLWRVIDGIDLDHSGSFLDWKGESVTW